MSRNFTEFGVTLGTPLISMQEEPGAHLCCEGGWEIFTGALELVVEALNLSDHGFAGLQVAGGVGQASSEPPRNPGSDSCG
jgi:hypothetical protein